MKVVDIGFFKGSLLGGMVGFSITLWLLMGSLSARKTHAPLPPVSMERCSSRSSNSTLFHSSMNYPIYASGRVFDGNNSSDKNYWNQTESPSHVVSKFLRKLCITRNYCIAYTTPQSTRNSAYSQRLYY